MHMKINNKNKLKIVKADSFMIVYHLACSYGYRGFGF